MYIVNTSSEAVADTNANETHLDNPSYGVSTRADRGVDSLKTRTVYFYVVARFPQRR